jgi:hypothetical protein
VNKHYSVINMLDGRAIAQAVSRPTASHRGGPGLSPGHVGFVLDKVALG